MVVSTLDLTYLNEYHSMIRP